MPTTRKTVAITVVGFLVGALAGGAGGLELGVWLTHRVLRPVLTASAGQAYMVLTLLDRKQEGKLRQMMELEVDAGISMLDTMETEGHLRPSDPQSSLRDQLKEYRRTHPRGNSGAQ